MKKRIMFYCQHVLGMGHLVRSVEIVKGFTDCEVLFLNGGEPLHGLAMPSFVRIVDLPPIVSDSQFDALQSADSSQNLQDIQRKRTQRLLTELKNFHPDVFMIELFPFGRLRFGFELIPVLARIRIDNLPVRVICSLRDILVSKSDQTRHEEWVCSLMNRYFDALLVHADPGFQKLDETFSRVKDLRCDIQYTGFVAQPLPEDSSDILEAMPRTPEESPLILVSIGGGRVGYELIEAMVRAAKIVQASQPCRLLIFTGPYLPPEQWESLEEMVKDQPHIALRRYTNRFLSYLQKADLSVSMAGYNTCMNLLTTGTRALVLPFTGRGNEEQTIRARKLERLGALRLLSPDELDPDRLASRIQEAFAGSIKNAGQALDMRGAEKTSEITRGLVEGFEPIRPTAPVGSVRRKPDHEAWQDLLRQSLSSLQANGKDVHLFLRDDDIDSDEDTLRTLSDITLSHGVPLNLEVIPGRLTPHSIRFLKNLKRIDPSLIELNQHGWEHVNHEKEGRKCEFGPSRTFEDQFQDIFRGKAVLEDTLEVRFYPVFTPPWNRCTADTFKVLDELGFKVLSKDWGEQLVTGYGFREISTTLDLYRWKGGATMKGQEEIVHDLIKQMANQAVIGLLLHHKVMDATAFAFLDDLLRSLRHSPLIRFHSFHSLVETSQ